MNIEDEIDKILESVAIKSANQYGGFLGWETPEERAEVIEEAKARLIVLIGADRGSFQDPSTPAAIGHEADNSGEVA